MIRRFIRPIKRPARGSPGIRRSYYRLVERYHAMRLARAGKRRSTEAHAGVILFLRYDLCLSHPRRRANYRQAGPGGRLLGFPIPHTKGAV